MNTSRNEDTELKQTGGAFADALTLARLLLTPVVMYLIVAHSWPERYISILVASLFAIAALTDFFDDFTGGAEKSKFRKFGWFDDIADTVLMCGTLAAMLFVFFTQDGFNIIFEGNSYQAAPAVPWLFVIPAAIIILRECVIGLTKGFELNRAKLSNSRLAGAKTAIIMLGTCVILAWPWLTSWLSSFFAKGGDAANVTDAVIDGTAIESAQADAFSTYGLMSDLVWNTGLVLLWVGALLSLITGYFLLTRRTGPANDG